MYAALFTDVGRCNAESRQQTRREKDASGERCILQLHERQRKLHIYANYKWAGRGRREGTSVSHERRRQALAESGLAHPHPDAVTAALFAGGPPFFFALDKLQVKYEMLRAHVLDGASVTDAAAAHGYSRGGFYVVSAAFAGRGMAGLLDDKRGRRGPLRVTDEIVEFVRGAPREQSGASLVGEVQERFGVTLHRRTVERARR